MRVFVVIFSLVILFTVNSQTYGQTNEQIDISEYFDREGRSWEAQYAEEIQTDKIILEIGKDHKVRITHVVEGGAWGPNTPKLIKMLLGDHSNPQLTDEDGDYLRPIGWVGETFEDSQFMIAGQKPSKAYDLHASYDLENFLGFKNGLWSKHVKFQHDVEIYIDEEIDLIFANSRPVDLGDSGGINCIGCDLKIEFFDEPKPIKKTVIRNDNKFEEISNAGKEFTLEFLTDGEIGDVNFIDELNYLSFDSKENQLFLLKIPLDLLLSPYHVYVTGIDQEILLESDKLRSTEIKQTDTHANVVFRPTSDGTVHVVGSDEMEHEKLLEQIEKRTPKPNPETDSNIKSEDQEISGTANVEQIYENWGNTNSDTESNMDNTVILVIIGIVAIVAIAVVVKIKRS